ncbi:hypothetical protein N9H35_00940 [bacterium]|nr:hypothetical protein [bacterium]
MSAKIDKEGLETEKILIEERKTKALEKIAVSLDALTVWFEEIDKEDWDGRIQFYLSEWHNNLTQGKDK